MKKMNNKGFSLVELIIVIAIMAILIAVLAPQYIKYVEKSRQSADLDNWQAIVNGMQVAYADVEAPLSVDTSVQYTGKNSTPTVTPALGTALENLGVNLSSLRMKSSLYSSATLKATVSADGIVTITCTDATGSLKKELGLK